MKFKDYFSNIASDYAAYRPDYPADLFTYLASLTSVHHLAWDCATGNGQAAIALAKYFKKVVATDASLQQISAAVKKENIEYRVMPAEKTDLMDHSVDLITVAQAIHWFDFDAFYNEVRRVLKPNGILAVWGYPMFETTTAFDKAVLKLYAEITQKFWDPRRKYLDENYTTIPFPFTRLKTPEFHIEKSWDFYQVINYLSTWSGIQAYMKQIGTNPLDLVMDDLLKAWGNPKTKRIIRWPICLLVTRPNE